MHQLDLKYQAKYDEINKKREQVRSLNCTSDPSLEVVNGSYEPSGAEVEYPSDKEEDEEDGEVRGVDLVTSKLVFYSIPQLRL